jgi:hypothetical protein
LRYQIARYYQKIVDEPIKNKRNWTAIALDQHDGVGFQDLNPFWEIFSLKSNVHIGQLLP